MSRSPSGAGHWTRALLALCSLSAPALQAQVPADLARERADYTAWLQSAPLSPYAALALQPVGAGISIGQEPSDIPLAMSRRGIARETRAGVTLDLGSERLALPLGRPVAFGGYRLVATGAPGRRLVSAFGAIRRFQPPTWFPWDSSFVVRATLEPPERAGSFRILGPEGTEIEATEAGFVTVQLAAGRGRLRVYSIAGDAEEEQELIVLFRDATGGKGSYPDGRFLTLEPERGDRYRLDFNRAHNPFCAYSSVYACPAPWPGNRLTFAVTVGERYEPAPAQP